MPHTQYTAYSGLHYVVRTAAEPAAMLETLRRAVLAYVPDKPAHSVTHYGEILAESLARERFASLLMGLFAFMAAALAALGLYAVVAFLVGQRTREIGVRMALGARPAQVFGQVLWAALVLGGWGGTLGLAGAAFTGRALTVLLYEVAPYDPPTLALAATGLVAVVALASWLPARRAMRVDPVVALRHE